MLIDGSHVRTAMIAMVLGLVVGAVNAQDDPSQRPLPLPDRGMTDLPQHIELLKRLRSLVNSQQKSSEKPATGSDTSPRRAELSSPADVHSTPENANESTPEPSPFQPQQLQQLQDALKNLASQLPPGFVPPDLSSVPPDQLRKAMENPVVQQQMRQMLEQFAKDGVLPKPGNTRGSPLPLPPQNAGRQNDRVEDDGTQGSSRKNEPLEDEASDGNRPSKPEVLNKASDAESEQEPAQAKGSPGRSSRGPAGQDFSGTSESAVAEPEASDSSTPDSSNDTPSGSMRSLRSFLKKLAEDAGIKPPNPSVDSSPRSNTAQSNSSSTEPESAAATDDQTMPAEPKTSSGRNGVPSARRPLRKRDSSKPRTSPPAEGSDSSATDSNSDLSDQFPKASPQPLNRPNALQDENIPENVPASDASESTPVVPNPASSSLPPGPRIDPDAARKQLEELQKTIERMKQVAEESDRGRSSTDGVSSPNDEGNQFRSNNSDDNSESNSVSPLGGGSNRKANRPDGDNRNGESLPESLPNVDEFLREQLKSFKLPPNAAPGSNTRNDAANKPPSSGTNPRIVDRRMPIDSIPRDLSMERDLTPEQLRRVGGNLREEKSIRPGHDPSDTENAKSDKPPIDIAKELEQRGFGNTLKQLVERAKEEAKKPREPILNPADAQEIAGNEGTTPTDIQNVLKDATGAAEKADPELSKSMAKMLDGLKDDLVKIAKDAKFNNPPQRSRSDRSMNRPSPAESNSIIDEIRRSASEILAGPSRSSNSGNTAASGASAAASNAFSGEFDFTPVLVLAGVLAALAIAFFGLRHFKFRGNDAAELQFAGPPLKPSDINTRADVVRAFHEFALRSAQSVQSWWTHRTVQQAILEKAPEYRAAVETLADTYEQARYLPVEQELSPEQLASARSALQQCSLRNSNG